MKCSFVFNDPFKPINIQSISSTPTKRNKDDNIIKEKLISLTIKLTNINKYMRNIIYDYNLSL